VFCHVVPYVVRLHYFTNPCPTASSDPATNTQAEFDHFYAVALRLLNQYYPERVITKTSRDPEFITAECAHQGYAAQEEQIDASWAG